MTLCHPWEVSASYLTLDTISRKPYKHCSSFHTSQVGLSRASCSPSRSKFYAVPHSLGQLRGTRRTQRGEAGHAAHACGDQRAGSKSRGTVWDSAAPAQPPAALEGSSACPAPPRRLEEVRGVVTSPPSGVLICKATLIAQLSLKAKPAVRWVP